MNTTVDMETRMVERVIDPWGRTAMVPDDGRVLEAKSLFDWGFGKTPEFSSMLHVDYDYARDHNYPRFAFTWDEVVREAVRVIGPEDTQAWLLDMDDILKNPRFLRTTQLGIIKKIREQPEFVGQTLVSPHRQAFSRLGWYLVWRPGQPPIEVQGENSVREALHLEKKAR